MSRYCFPGMGTKQFYTLPELEDMLSDPDCFKELEMNHLDLPLGIVEVPPDTVDIQGY